MKKDTHPQYQEVLFVDTSTGTRFVCRSTLRPEETESFEGKEYPVYRVPISSASHPLFTGSQQFLDTEGRVDKFLKRYRSPQPQAASPSKKEEGGEKEKSKGKEKKQKPASKTAKKKSSKK